MRVEAIVINQELEYYLARLEKSLGPIAISEKAEIITEIKSHVLEALSSDDERSIGHILAALGEPEQVANKYLLERGLKPQNPPRHPIVKWLTIGFLGTFAMSIFTFFIIVWKFSPLVKVDEEKGHVQILGGLIDVQEEGAKVKISGKGDLFFDRDFSLNINEDGVAFSGQEKVSQDDVKKIQLLFSNGTILVKNSKDQSFRYDCKLKGFEGEVKPLTNDGVLTLNLTKSALSHCEVELPELINLLTDGKNGKLEIKKIKNNYIIKLLNGSVDIQPDQGIKYRYQMDVKNGKVDTFDSSLEEGALTANVSVLNGLINRVEEK